MITPLQKLKKILSTRPLIIGIGNDLRGDDGAGIELVKQIQELGYHNSLMVYGNPENYLFKIAALPGESRLWIDIMNWGGHPGDFTLIAADDINHFAISTHNFSPKVLLEFLKTYRDIPDYFLGIQPLDIQMGNPISEPVMRTIKKLSHRMMTCLK